MNSILPSSRISRRTFLSTLAALAALPSLLLFTAARGETPTRYPPGTMARPAEGGPHRNRMWLRIGGYLQIDSRENDGSRWQTLFIGRAFTMAGDVPLDVEKREAGVAD